MEKPTIVQLTESSGIQIATFEEAFGEHSELRGRGRDRRAKRKSSKRSAKQAKIESRLKRRATKKVGRQDVRAEKQAAKQSRKTANLSSRLERRDMRRPDELEPEELTDETSTSMQDAGDQRGGYSKEDSIENSSIGEGEGTAESDDDASEPAYHDTNDEESEEENDQDYAESEESDDDESGFNGGSQFEYDNVDGVNQFTTETVGERTSTAEIQKRIDINKDLIEKINQNLANLRQSLNRKMSPEERRSIIAKMHRFKGSLDMRNNRLTELTTQLESFSQASGKRAVKQASRQQAKVNKVAAKQERRAVKQAGKTAHVAAKQERKAIKQEGRSSRVAAKQEGRASKRNNPADYGVTEVEQGLNAEIEDNRIEVPADEMSSANGLDIYAMGNKNEEFVPEDRIVEIKYGADGIAPIVGKIVSPNIVLVGAAILVGYWLNKKYQFIKL